MKLFFNKIRTFPINSLAILSIYTLTAIASATGCGSTHDQKSLSKQPPTSLALQDIAPEALPDSEEELRELSPPVLLHSDKSFRFGMAAVGDSITAGFNAYRPLINRDYSWATGWRANGLVDSIYLKLMRAVGNVSATNVAISGSKAEDIGAQIDKLADADLDYISVLIGANDVCQWPADYKESLQTYKADVARGLAQLTADHKGIHIDLGTIPNIMHLYNLGKSSGACQRKWNTTKFCSLLRSDTTAADVEAFAASWRDANAALAEIAQRFPDNVRLITKLSAPIFTPDEISPYDCFHPNTDGQSMLANIVWDGGWLKPLVAAKLAEH